MEPHKHGETAMVRSTAGTTRHIREVSLFNGRHRYVFRYETGREEDVIQAFAELAVDAEQSFDWLDAAVLTYQMGRTFAIAAERGKASV